MYIVCHTRPSAGIIGSFNVSKD